MMNIYLHLDKCCYSYSDYFLYFTFLCTIWYSKYSEK